MSAPGKLIVFEGTEGSGKSTLMGRLHARMASLGLEVLRTREPGGSDVAESIRKVLLEHEMDPWTELFLYEAARREHWVKVLRPALLAGKWVLCDRFTVSTVAYQGWARGLPLPRIHLLNRLATDAQKIDLGILLDLSPELGLKRASDPNRFEREALKFHRKVRQGYRSYVSQHPKNWVRVSAEKSADEVEGIVWKRMQILLKARKVTG
jgi:dTMP kinase